VIKFFNDLVVRKRGDEKVLVTTLGKEVINVLATTWLRKGDDNKF
jgi:hypothetical protein